MTVKNNDFNCQNKQGVRHKTKGKKLTLQIFKIWPFKEDFSAEIDELEYIVSLVCKVWCDSLAHKK